MCASRVRRSVVAIATAGLLGFAGVGCTSSDDPPEPAPLPTESPGPSGSELESAPTPPPEAKEKSRKGAKTFIRAYIETVNYATRSGDVAPLRAMATSECQSCTDVADRIESVYDAGGSIESKGWRISSIAPVPGQPSLRPVIDIGLLLSPQVVVASAVAEPERFDGGRLPATFHMQWSAGEWKVARWDRAA